MLNGDGRKICNQYGSHSCKMIVLSSHEKLALCFRALAVLVGILLSATMFRIQIKLSEAHSLFCLEQCAAISLVTQMSPHPTSLGNKHHCPTLQNVWQISRFFIPQLRLLHQFFYVKIWVFLALRGAEVLVRVAKYPAHMSEKHATRVITQRN